MTDKLWSAELGTVKRNLKKKLFLNKRKKKLNLICSKGSIREGCRKFFYRNARWI